MKIANQCREFLHVSIMTETQVKTTRGLKTNYYKKKINS